MTRAKTREIDMTTGSILGKLIRFAIPLILMNMLQLLFNAADVAVLGIFVNDDAVGSVGATTSLIQLLVNLFIGLSVGTNVVLSKAMGERNKQKAEKVVGTSVLLGLTLGAGLIFVGFFGAETFLTWMGCDPLLLPDAVTYLKIYFLGMPIILVYNFLAAIMRAVGDTFRPMIFLLIAGVINVGLNIFFILVLGMTVDGVAIATVTSQAVSVILSFIITFKSKGYAQLKLRCIRFYKQEIKEIVKVGLPAGIQSSLFSVSNVLISSTINSFLAPATTGSAIASQFDAIVYTVGNSLALACMSFVSQNYGAGKINRIKQVISRTFVVTLIMSFSIGMIVYLLGEPLCRIMSDDPKVLEYAGQRLSIMCLTYFICGWMDTISYVLRALGKSMTAMIISLCCICAFRIIWLNSIYLLNPVYWMIFISYPVSWILDIVVALIFMIPLIKKVERIVSERNEERLKSSLQLNGEIKEEK